MYTYIYICIHSALIYPDHQDSDCSGMSLSSILMKIPISLDHLILTEAQHQVPRFAKMLCSSIQKTLKCPWKL